MSREEELEQAIKSAQKELEEIRAKREAIQASEQKANDFVAALGPYANEALAGLVQVVPEYLYDQHGDRPAITCRVYFNKIPIKKIFC